MLVVDAVVVVTLAPRKKFLSARPTTPSLLSSLPLPSFISASRVSWTREFYKARNERVGIPSTLARFSAIAPTSRHLFSVWRTFPSILGAGILLAIAWIFNTVARAMTRRSLLRRTATGHFLVRGGSISTHTPCHPPSGLGVIPSGLTGSFAFPFFQFLK
jgi:hypothetical protein